MEKRQKKRRRSRGTENINNKTDQKIQKKDLGVMQKKRKKMI